MVRFLGLSAVLPASLLFTSTSFAKPQNDVLPRQLRLAYAGEKGMMVSWNTYSQLTKPTVRYGRKPNQLDQEASSDVSVTYETSLTYNNHVPLLDLEPGTVYYYLPEHSNATEPYSFMASRPVGDQTPYSVAVAIDMGVMGPEGLTTHVGKGAGHPLKPGDNNTMQSLQEQGASTDFLWHRMFSFLNSDARGLHIDHVPNAAGDIAYADYWLKEEIQGFLPNTTIADGYKVYESLLNQYYDEMSAITSKKPYMVGPGNHEANCKIDPPSNEEAAIYGRCLMCFR